MLARTAIAGLLMGAVLGACGPAGISSDELVGVWRSSDGDGAVLRFGADHRFSVRGLPRAVRPTARGSAPLLDGDGSWTLPTSGMHAHRVRLALDAGAWSDVIRMDEMHVAGSEGARRLVFVYGDVDARQCYAFEKE